MKSEVMEFEPMPTWVLDGFKDALIEDIEETHIIKTVEDAFFFTRGWFSQKGCVPKEALDFIAELIRSEKLK